MPRLEAAPGQPANEAAIDRRVAAEAKRLQGELLKLVTRIRKKRAYLSYLATQREEAAGEINLALNQYATVIDRGADLLARGSGVNVSEFYEIEELEHHRLWAAKHGIFNEDPLRKLSPDAAAE